MALKYVGLGIVFLWFAVGGVFHFVTPDAFERIVPPYVPAPLAMVYISGFFELLGAVGILFPKWRSRAGIGLFVLTVCVTPANVHMWMHPELFPTISNTFLALRLPVQVLLLACIWWSTRPPKTAAT
jgi:uncharacterized membrane protein